MRPAPIEPPPVGLPGMQPPLVLDLPVLLSPFGLWLARRLALAAQVWLPSVFPRLLEENADGEEYMLAQLRTCLGRRHQGQLERNLASWRHAWPDITQTPRIYWFADALDNSRAPKGLSPASLDRLDELRSGLCARVGPGEPVPVEVCDPVLEGSADALAVAAMLAPERALIVSASASLSAARGRALSRAPAFGNLADAARSPGAEPDRQRRSPPCDRSSRRSGSHAATPGRPTGGR
jgi:hypothetical protein